MCVTGVCNRYVCVTMSLQEVLVMEYRLSQRCVEDKDFYEGVRAGTCVCDGDVCDRYVCVCVTRCHYKKC